MIKIHTMIKIWPQFVQPSKYVWSKFIKWSNKINYYFQRSKIIFKKLVSWSNNYCLWNYFKIGTYYLYRILRNRENQWKPHENLHEKIDPKIQLGFKFEIHLLKITSQIGWGPHWAWEARMAERPDWLGGQIGWEARLAGRPNWLGGQIGWETRLDYTLDFN